MDSNLCEFLDDPARRRVWLLTKALEGAPLAEALAMAKAAEAFLTGRAVMSQREAAAHRSIELLHSHSVH
jgi:hypothetical protein